MNTKLIGSNIARLRGYRRVLLVLMDFPSESIYRLSGDLDQIRH